MNSSKADRQSKEPPPEKSNRFRRSYRQYRSEFTAMTPEEQEEENRLIILFILRRITAAAIINAPVIIGGGTPKRIK